VIPIPDRIAILASGGLDSSVMLGQIARAGRHVFPVYIRAGLTWESSELATLRRFVRALAMRNIEPVTTLRLPMGDLAGEHWSMTGRDVPGYDAAVSSNYILGRNLSLLAKASIFCAYNRIGEIAMAPLESNPFPDARPEFFRAFARAVELGVGIKLKIKTPFAGLTKADVVRRGAGMRLELTKPELRIPPRTRGNLRGRNYTADRIDALGFRRRSAICVQGGGLVAAKGHPASRRYRRFVRRRARRPAGKKMLDP
jgi:7-cyano-7-deazaguanine synthase